MAFRFIKAIMLVFFVSGCAAVVLVGAGAAGGYAIGRDYVQGEADRNFESVYTAAVNVADGMGTIASKVSNPSIAKIQATVGTSSLEIVIEKLTRQAIRLKVKSRKNLLPNLELAQKVYNNILQQSK